MRLITIGIANVDSTVGAVDANLKKMIECANQMGECTIGIFPEQVFGGYPAEDLVQVGQFVESQANALEAFAAATQELTTVFVLGIAVKSSGFVFNANAVVHRGRVLGVVPKEHLPTYGVFYEHRVFTAGKSGSHNNGIGPVPFGDLVFKFPFGTMATCVCEDSWVPDGPLATRSDAELQIVTNASPNRVGVLDTRRQMLATRSADNECVLAAAYAVGGNDSLVFDGGGFCFQNGQLIGEASRFREGITVFEVDLARTDRLRQQNSTWRARQKPQGERRYATVIVDPGPGCIERSPSREFARRFGFLPKEPAARANALDEIIETIVMGLDGYFTKTGAFDKVLISLSGGKDSALTLIFAWLWALRKEDAFKRPSATQKALVSNRIFCLSQPTRFNTTETKDIARSLAEELGAEFFELPIHNSFAGEEEALWAIMQRAADRTTSGNIQARIRGMRMWNLANSMKGLWLQTGNMSEKAVGYTTIGGDLMGGYSLIGNLPKTVVSELLVHLGAKYGIKTVDALMQTCASAELAEGQFDEDELMPFPVLDLCYLLYVGEMYAPDDMYRIMRAYWTDAELLEMSGRDDGAKLKEWIERFVKLFRQSIFKWVQSPQAVHIGSLDLDRERALQIPVVFSNAFLEQSLERMRSMEN